jgi:hypothetical protein
VLSERYELGFITQKTAFFIVTTVKASNLTYVNGFTENAGMVGQNGGYHLPSSVCVGCLSTADDWFSGLVSGG